MKQHGSVKKDEFGVLPNEFNPLAAEDNVVDEFICREEYSKVSDTAPLPKEFEAPVSAPKVKKTISFSDMKKKLLPLIIIASVVTFSITLGGNSNGVSDTQNSPTSNTLEPTTDATETLPSDKPESTLPANSIEAFPTLSNLTPDTDGAYAWAGMGSEEYVRIYDSLTQTYLHRGTYYQSVGILASELSGASYDLTTNTLTLTDFSGGFLDVNLMGNGFKIVLKGNNKLDGIKVWGAMYGGSVTFTGDGSLKVGSQGICLEAENSESCIMIDSNVALDITGSPALLVNDSKLEKTIYFLSSNRIKEGRYLNSTIVDENDLPLTNVVIERISGG